LRDQELAYQLSLAIENVYLVRFALRQSDKPGSSQSHWRRDANSPLEHAASQSGQANHPSANETGLNVSHHTASLRRAGRSFFLDILFHRALSRFFANQEGVLTNVRVKYILAPQTVGSLS